MICVCIAFPCDPFQVANSNATSLQSGNTSDTVMVQCDEGYTSTDGNMFVVSCYPSGTTTYAWTNVLTCAGMKSFRTACRSMCVCVAVVCDSFDVANSNASSPQSGNTTDTVLVQCDDGYTSTSGNTFVVSCDPSGAATSAWTNVLTCAGMNLCWIGT